jgi:hypothetical protein
MDSGAFVADIDDLNALLYDEISDWLNMSALQTKDTGHATALQGFSDPCGDRKIVSVQIHARYSHLKDPWGWRHRLDYFGIDHSS